MFEHEQEANEEQQSMPDKIDIQAVTRALENGKGCEVHDQLTSIPWAEQSQIFKDIRNANQEHLKK